MSSKLTFVFFLWRRQGTTPEQFADYYNRDHLEFISTMVPMPSIHERSFPLDSNLIIPANRPREGILSFDSFTAVTFDARSDYEARLPILADESKRRQLEADEDKFTQSERRVTYVAEVESREAPDYEQLTSSAVNVLQISRRCPGIERAEFKSAYEAEIHASRALPGELRHMRYYLLPEHPFSSSRGAWGDLPKSTMDVVQDIAFRNHEAAEQAAARNLSAAQKSKVIDEAVTMMIYTRRASGTPETRLRQ